MQFQRPDGFITVLEQIGSSQHSRVFRVSHSAYTYDFVLKITSPERAFFFFQTYPYIVPVLDAWQDTHHAYLLMPLYASDARHTRPTPSQVFLWISQIAEALQHTHEAGFVHQDIKPDNVLIDYNGSIALTDFSIAVPINTIGAPPATPLYASPEQLFGEKVTAASDIYALGIMLHEWLNGAHPFAHLSAKAALMHQLNEPLPLLGHAADALIAAMTRKTPEDRIGLAEAMEVLDGL